MRSELHEMAKQLGLGLLVLLFWIVLERRLRGRIFETTGKRGPSRTPVQG